MPSTVRLEVFESLTKDAKVFAKDAWRFEDRHDKSRPYQSAPMRHRDLLVNAAERPSSFYLPRSHASEKHSNEGSFSE
jgi:hypothetical protein